MQSKRDVVLVLLGFVALVIVIHLEVRGSPPVSNLADPANAGSPQDDTNPSSIYEVDPPHNPIINNSSGTTVSSADPRFAASNPGTTTTPILSPKGGGTIHY